MPAALAKEQRSAFAPKRAARRTAPRSKAAVSMRVSRAFALLALRLHSQKVADHLMTALCQYGLRVKLHALKRQRAVAEPHNDRPALLAGAVGFRRTCRHYQFPGQRILGHDQRVVACTRKRGR